MLNGGDGAKKAVRVDLGEAFLLTISDCTC